MVFVAHATWLPRYAVGPVAMDVFFALSGFLIASQIVGEQARTGTVRLGGFYRRRAWRLLPALCAMLAVWFLVSLLFADAHWITSVPGGGPGSGIGPWTSVESVAAALCYATNWLTAFPGLRLWVGYSPLGHLWSLSVQEQFYVLWVPLMVLLLVNARRWVVPVTLAVVGLSLSEGIVLLRDGASSNWIYMGTDTRAASLLLGCVLAVWWVEGRTAWIGRTAPGFAVTAAAVGALLWCLRGYHSPPSSTRHLVAWVLATMAGGAAVVAIAEWSRGWLARLLAVPVVVYVGTRSYALYLWHYVWLTWFRSLGSTGTLLALAASLASAEVSWRLIESRALARSRGRPAVA